MLLFVTKFKYYPYYLHNVVLLQRLDNMVISSNLPTRVEKAVVCAILSLLCWSCQQPADLFRFNTCVATPSSAESTSSHFSGSITQQNSSIQNIRPDFSFWQRINSKGESADKISIQRVDERVVARGLQHDFDKEKKEETTKTTSSGASLLEAIEQRSLDLNTSKTGSDSVSEGIHSESGNSFQLSSEGQRRLLSKNMMSVVKVFVDCTQPDFFAPWQMQTPRERSGSAFVIEGKRLMTNAHIVEGSNRVLVRKHGNAAKFPATIIAVAHDCDLALLAVESEAFWTDLEPLEFGDVPQLRDTVTLLGYPIGGGQLSITEGVVSRVGMFKYIHSSYYLLTVQIDAAINAGNSGGPAFVAGKVVGVAFQGFNDLQNIGYIVPYPVIRHFLNDLALHNRYTGFPTLGFKYANMENEYMKEYKGVKSIDPSQLPSGVTLTGVIVVDVDNVRRDRYFSGKMKLPYASKLIPEKARYTRILPELISTEGVNHAGARDNLKLQLGGKSSTTNVRYADDTKDIGVGGIEADLPHGVTKSIVGGHHEKGSSVDLSDSAVGDSVTCEEDLMIENFHLKGKKANPANVGLQEGDVILAVDGVDIADDGTVYFRDLERVQLDNIVLRHFNGQLCSALILRDGSLKNVTIPLTMPNMLLPLHTWEMKPKYFVFGGLVFTPLTKQLGKHVQHIEIPTFIYSLASSLDFQKEEHDEIVILSMILASELTVGYNYAPAILRAVQNEPVKNLAHVVQLVTASTDRFLKFVVEIEECKRVPIVLDRVKAIEITSVLQKQHSIMADRSAFL